MSGVDERTVFRALFAAVEDRRVQTHRRRLADHPSFQLSVYRRDGVLKVAITP